MSNDTAKGSVGHGTPEEVLLDKCLFTVDEATYRSFVDRLGAPPKPNPKLHALMHGSARWER